MKSSNNHTLAKSNLFFLIIIFFIAQLAYHFAHAGFFSAFNTVDYFVVDYGAIFSKPDHFWESIFYYHLTPPLYALYAALFYKWFPPLGELGFYLLHTMLGLYAVYALYMLQRKLEINAYLATFMTTAFILGPSFNLVESAAFYDFPTLCLIIISGWHLTKLVSQPKFLNAFTFFIVVSLVCSIRSLYHVFLYFLPLIIVTAFIFKSQWKMIVLSSFIPFLFVITPYVKNYILFDMWGTSSYFGETLDSIAMQFVVNLKERETGIKKGFFSEMALCPSSPDTARFPTHHSKYSGWYCYTTFANKFREAYIKKLGKNYQNIPLLSCDPFMTQDGFSFPRRSCLGNIGMSKEYQKNAIQAIWHYPRSYWHGILSSLRQYFNTHVSFYFYRSLPESIRASWFKFPLMNKPNPALFISIPLTVTFPLLWFFAICFMLYSRKGVLFFLKLYALAFAITIYWAYLRLTPHHFTYIFQEWGLQAKLIVYLLKMFFAISVIALIFRFYIFASSKFKKRSLANSFIKPAMTHDKRILVFYLLANILYTSFVIIFFVGIMQNRYRIYIDGLYLVLLSLLFHTLFFKQQQ